MKRLLILLALLALVMPVAGLSLTFQDVSEFANYITCTGSGTHTCTYIQSADGGNSYIRTTITGAGSRSYIINQDPSQTTYAAATAWSSGASGFASVILYDSGMGTLYSYTPAAGSPNGRYEVKMIGGQAYIYKDGALVDVSGVLAQNPSYVGFGNYVNIAGTFNSYWDDFVYGTSENRYIFGSPEQGYFIKKDMINPAASGFYKADGTLISSNNMTTEWGFGNSNASQTIILKEWSGASSSWTKDTTAGTMAGTIAWPLQEAIFNNPSSPYGYYITTVSGSGEVSSVIPYIADGANVAFDQDEYARGDTATVTYSVDSGGYWDTTKYSYRLDLMNVYGTVVDTKPVTSQTGGKTFDLEQDYDLGVYYAVLIADPIAAGEDDLWMNYDTMELTGYLAISGNTYDGETATILNGVNVTIEQGSTAYIHTTAADGNYTTAGTAFYSGIVTEINATASGYWPYQYSFTPLEGKTISGRNITLRPLAPTCTGICLDGLVQDTVYGRPIPTVLVTVSNTTFGESYTDYSNAAGYYKIDETDGAIFANERWYSIVGSKTGFSNSGSYLKQMVGV